MKPVNDCDKLINKTLEKLEKENQELKSKIKDAHVENASLMEDFNEIAPSLLYKFWKIIKPLYNLFKN